MKKNNKLEIIAIIVLIIFALFSFFYLGDKYTKPENCEKTIQILDKKKDNVLGLVASSTTLSATLSLIPGDAGTPIANQFADLSSYLLIILAILYSEKYLLTVIGLIVFKALIPFSCIAICINIFLKNYSLSKIIAKILSASLVLFLIIPISTRITNMIDETYQASLINKVSDLVEETAEEPIQEIENNTQANENKPWYSVVADYIKNAIDNITNTAANATDAIVNYGKDIVEKAKTALNNFIEAIAVMLVTSCVIPLVTFFLFVWLMKLILELDIKMTGFTNMGKGISGTLSKIINNNDSTL